MQFQVALSTILGLAIDVNNGKSNSDIKPCIPNENCRICNEECVNKLNEKGWFRTVRYDPFHFTFLGYAETELPSKGLKQVECKQKRGAGTGEKFKYWFLKY